MPGGRAADFEVYPAARVNASAAAAYDYADGLTRFEFARRWTEASRTFAAYNFTFTDSSAVFAFISAGAAWGVCAHARDDCLMGELVAKANLMTRTQGLDRMCTAKGLVLTSAAYLAKPRLAAAYGEQLRQMHDASAAVLRDAGLTAASVPVQGSCTADGELALLVNLRQSLEERYQPQRALFDLLAAADPNSFAPAASDLRDLTFSHDDDDDDALAFGASPAAAAAARPARGWAKLGFAYGSGDDGADLLTRSDALVDDDDVYGDVDAAGNAVASAAPAAAAAAVAAEYARAMRRLLPKTAAAHDEGRDVFEIAHSCLPVDDGLARSARLARHAGAAPEKFFCAWRRQHDASPANVAVYAGWTDGALRPLPGGPPPQRLTAGDDPRLFVHRGAVHAVYNDAWRGDGAALSDQFPPHHTRGNGAGGGSAPTICVWVARLNVPAASATEPDSSAERASPPRALAPSLLSARVQLVPPAELRAGRFRESADTFPFGKNYMPFEHRDDDDGAAGGKGGAAATRLVFIYSLAPLALIECPQLDADLDAAAADAAAAALAAALGGAAASATGRAAGLEGGGGISAPPRARPRRRVSVCVWSSLQPARARIDPRKMGGLRGSTPAHALPGGRYVVGLGHLRFNHLVATPFAFRLDLHALRGASAAGGSRGARGGGGGGGGDGIRGDGGEWLALAYPDGESFAAPVAWVGGAAPLPAFEANPISLYADADGGARAFVSLKRGTDFLAGSSAEHTFQTVAVAVRTRLFEVGRATRGEGGGEGEGAALDSGPAAAIAVSSGSAADGQGSRAGA